MLANLPLEVDYPPRILNPNRSQGRHWSKISKAKRNYKNTVFTLAYAALRNGKLAVPMTDKIHLHLRFYPPHTHRRAADDDNAEAAFKAGRDGLAEAIRRDDACFVTSKEMMPRDPMFKFGKVEIELTPID